MEYYRDEPNNPPDDDNYNADSIANSALFKYKGSIAVKILKSDDNDNNEQHNEKKLKSKNCWAIKIFKQFLENFRYPIDQL